MGGKKKAHQNLWNEKRHHTRSQEIFHSLPKDTRRSEIESAIFHLPFFSIPAQTLYFEWGGEGDG